MKIFRIRFLVCCIRSLLLVVFFSVLCAYAAADLPSYTQTDIIIDDSRQLFVDSLLIQELDRCEMVLHQPRK